MNKARLTPWCFTVRLGHPVFIFFWSVWMEALGVVLGVHASSSLACRRARHLQPRTDAMITAHELIDAFIWSTLTAWWICRRQGRRERPIE